MFFNSLILVSDQDRISLYNINTRSGRQLVRIKRNISLYQILKTQIVRILFYFHSMPLALLSRACCFETCNTCCASINQFSCLLSSDQTFNAFSNGKSVLSDGRQKKLGRSIAGAGNKSLYMYVQWVGSSEDVAEATEVFCCITCCRILQTCHSCHVWSL